MVSTGIIKRRFSPLKLSKTCMTFEGKSYSIAWEKIPNVCKCDVWDTYKIEVTYRTTIKNVDVIYLQLCRCMW